MRTFKLERKLLHSLCQLSAVFWSEAIVPMYIKKVAFLRFFYCTRALCSLCQSRCVRISDFWVGALVKIYAFRSLAPNLDCRGAQLSSSHWTCIKAQFENWWRFLVHQEDELLLKLVHEHGVIQWCDIAAHFHKRTGKQCSERSVTIAYFLLAVFDHRLALNMDQVQSLCLSWNSAGSLVTGRGSCDSLCTRHCW